MSEKMGQIGFRVARLALANPAKLFARTGSVTARLQLMIPSAALSATGLPLVVTRKRQGCQSILSNLGRDGFTNARSASV